MTVSHALAQTEPFARTRFTYLAYAFMALTGLCISILGPTMPFVAEQLSLSYTQIGLHFSLFSLGIVFTSLVGDKIVMRTGYRQMGWLSSVLLAAAYIGLIASNTLWAALVSAMLYGIGFGLLFIVIMGTLARAHPLHGTKAYTEANIAAGLGAIAGPLAVGILAASAFDWKSIAVIPVLFTSTIVILFRDTPFPAMDDTPAPGGTASRKDEPLPHLFWVFAVLLFLVVAMEFSVLSWTPNFLSTVIGYSPDSAAAMVSIFNVAIVTGRLLGRRVLENVSEGRLLVLALVWVLLCFPLYLYSRIPSLNVAGLFFLGLGIGNLAPLSLSGAMAAASEQASRASARISTLPSLGNLVMLQLVGIIADYIGIQRAFSLVILLAVLALTVVLYSNRLRGETA